MKRRDFVTVSAAAGGGILFGLQLPVKRAVAAETAAAFEPNAFIRIDRSSRVTIWFSRSELGQGVKTGLPMIVAEELEADWDNVHVEQADADPQKYGRMSTGGSFAVRGAWNQLRKAGATGRVMLIAAAAQMWDVDPSTVRADNGMLIHDASSRRLTFGDVADVAATLPVPDDPPLKDPKDFRLLGTPARRVDIPDKVNGSATFGIDVRTPGMLFGTVVRCPVFGGSLVSVDDTKARTVPGVRDVVTVSGGVAVVADNTWAAFQGAKQLDIVWDEGEFANSNTPDISQRLSDLCAEEGAVARSEGDVDAAFANAAREVQADYEVPYLAHATMEPMNCTADVREDRVEVWAPTQNPQRAAALAAQLTGLPIEKATLHITMLGGGFGRRSENDFVQDAVETSKAIGAPVQITWTREADMQHDYYRPATYNRFAAALDGENRVLAWKHRIAGGSIVARFSGGRLRNGIDGSSVEGAANIPYAIPNVHVDWCHADIGVPLGWWRSVGSSQNAFITESFIDELAHAASQDLFEFRRGLLAKHPRHLGVLELAADKANWGSPLPAGRARGRRSMCRR